MTQSLLSPAYEPGDGSAVGAQLVDGEWWHPVFGCDSLQDVVDNARAAIALDRSRRAPQPPAEGEVAELVAELYADAKEWRDLSEYSEGAKCHRAAELLQLQQAEIQKLWTWLLACEGTANARAGGSSKPKWPAHALPMPQGEVQP